MDRLRIATVDGIDRDQIAATISDHAMQLPLDGMYCVMENAIGDLILGRIGGGKTWNETHASDTFAMLRRQWGEVPHWSGVADIKSVSITVLACVGEDRYQKSYGLDPSTGMSIYIPTPEELAFFSREQSYLLTIGYVPFTNNLPAQVINRNFSPPDPDGLDNGSTGTGAQHTAIYGKTGSGKTVLATILLAGKLLAHPKMGLFIPDIAGDLSDPKGMRGGNSFRWNYAELLQQSGIPLDILSIDEIRLTSQGSFIHLLGEALRDALNMGPGKERLLARHIGEALFEEDEEVAKEKINAADIVDHAVTLIGPCYATSSRKDKMAEAEAWRSNERSMTRFVRSIESVKRYFDGKESLKELISQVLQHGRKVVLRIQSARLGDEGKEFVMREVMYHLTKRSRAIFYARREQPSNALVVLDEGKDWVPQGSQDGDIGYVIERAFNQTRKEGVGWMVIGQRPSDVSKTVLTQAHDKYFGKGLAVGNDLQHLKDHIGEDGVAIYKRLQRERGYAWVGIGDSATMGSGGEFFSFNTFNGDVNKAFVDANADLFVNKQRIAW